MSTTYKLTYDPTEAQAGFKLVAQAIKELESAGVKIPAELQAIASRMEQVQAAADAAEATTDDFSRELAEIAKFADQASDELGSFAVSTAQVAAAQQRAAASANAMGNAVGGSVPKVDRLKDAAGGLDAVLTTLGFGTLGAVAGGIERLVMGYKDLTAATAASEGATKAAGATSAAAAIPIGAIAAAVASIVAIVGSVIVLWKDYSETIEQTADKNSMLDGTLLKVLHTLGLISDETLNTSEQLKAEGEALDAATKAMTENEKATVAAQIAKQKFNQEAAAGARQMLEESRAAAQQAETIANVTDPEEASQMIEGMIRDLEALAAAGKVDEATKARYYSSIQQMEQRRIELVKERDAKEREAAERDKQELAERSKAMEESFRREDELAEANYQKQKEREKSEQEAKEKAEADEKQRKLDQLKDIVASGDEAVEQIERVKEAAEGPTEQATGPGEQNPYAAAMDPLANALAGGFGESIGGDTGSSGPARGTGRGEVIRNLADQAIANDPSLSRSRATRNARQQFNADAADGSFDDEAVVEAQQKALDKQIENEGKRRGLADEQIGLLQEMARGFADSAREQDRQAAEIRKIKDLWKSIFGRRDFGGGNFGRTG